MLRCGGSGTLPTLTEGTLTVGTDKPAYPPYFEDDDPSNGKGFESAVAYAVAGKLGYATEDVKWVVVPFNKSYAPGNKDFDFDINQISITPKRAEAVTFSEGYYTVNQAVVALNDSPIANATTVDELKTAKLGAQVGTTSLAFIQDVVARPSPWSTTTPTTPRARSRPARSMASWWTFPRPTTSRRSSSTTPRSWVSSRPRVTPNSSVC